MKKFMLLPLLLVVLISFSAYAKGPGCMKDKQWWQNDKITSELNLSESQQTQINDIAAKYDPALTEAREDVTAKKTAYKDAKSNKATSDADVIKAFDVMWDAKYKMKRIKLDRGLEIRQVLTQEQIDQLKEIKQAHKERMMKKYHKKHQKNLEEETSQ